MKILCLLLLATVAVARGFLLDDTCQGRCGGRYDRVFPCQCNDQCQSYGNCCGDYTTLCATQDTCQGRCGGKYDRALPCQCNDQCQSYGNCCGDYSTLCAARVATSSAPSRTQAPSGGNNRCDQFTTVTQRLWDLDVDRLSTSDVTMNYQTQLPDQDGIKDESPQRLFNTIDESKLSSPVYSTFRALLDNYDPLKNRREDVTAEDKAEEEAFLDAIMATDTVGALYDYLLCRDIVRDRADLRKTLRRVWFDLYRRSGSGTVDDTSGFEHVMVGEYKSSSQVNGMHSWLAFYDFEQAGEMDYYGHTCAERPNVACAAFDWEGRTKTKASFFLRVSPAFDIAIYSICFLAGDRRCRTVVDGRTLYIQTYAVGGHLSTAYIAA